MGPALVATKGQASPEVLHAYARARELCQQVRETPQLFQVLRGLWFFYLIRLDLQTARELGEHLLTKVLTYYRDFSKTAPDELASGAVLTTMPDGTLARGRLLL